MKVELLWGGTSRAVIIIFLSINVVFWHFVARSSSTKRLRVELKLTLAQRGSVNDPAGPGGAT